MSRTATRTVLVLGDFALLLAAVPLMLALRTLALPTVAETNIHLLPFSLLAVIFVGVFFSAGLYDPVTTIVRRELPGTILGVQLANVIFAAVFFFFVPEFGITPKTNLVIYLAVSAVLLSLWHLFAPLRLQGGKARAVVVGDGAETEELLHECAHGACPFTVVGTIPVSGRSTADIQPAISAALAAEPEFLILDTNDDRLQPVLSALSFRTQTVTSLVGFSDVYEDVFRKVPLSSLSHQWFFPGRSPRRIVYSACKRAFDILIGVFLSVLLAVCIPFVWLALRLEGPGTLFIRQQRMGAEGSTISVLKFRSMRFNKSASREWTVEEKNENPVTRVGAFLRKTSLDELPQVVSVLTGDLSLIGPRSDILGLAERLADAIPFYMFRYAVTPGISGWAQVNQRYSPGNISPQSIEESRVRLSYDLYYVKHRSPLLDLSITLRTLKTLITRWFS